MKWSDIHQAIRPAAASGAEARARRKEQAGFMEERAIRCSTPSGDGIQSFSGLLNKLSSE